MNMNIFGFKTFTEYEYEYIWIPNFLPNMNSNIFEFQIFTEYEYIRVPNCPSLRIYLEILQKGKRDKIEEFV
jgi:hypothetical protein